jgi:hypothetical protein
MSLHQLRMALAAKAAVSWSMPDVAGDIVDAIGCSAPEFGDDKIVHANFLGRALGSPFAPGVLEVADQFLLLGVDRDRRLTRRERFFYAIVDVAELRVAIGVM